MKLTRLHILILLIFSNFTISQDESSFKLEKILYESDATKPICLIPEKSGSVEHSSSVGTLLTLGLNTVGKFRCAFFWRVDGKYESDCNELKCRTRNRQEILERADELIIISNKAIKQKNIASSTKNKIRQGVRGLESTIIKWKKTNNLNFSKTNSIFLEQYLSFPLEHLIENQLNLLPNEFQKMYLNVFKKKYEEELKRIRIAEELERKRIAEELERKRIAEELERKKRAEELAKELEQKTKNLITFIFIALPIVILYIIISSISNSRIAKRNDELEKKELEEKKKENARLIEQVNLSINDNTAKFIDQYKKRYRSIDKEFLSIHKKIMEEEEELADLKSRHPKVELITESRQIGDADSELVQRIKDLLIELSPNRLK